MDVKILTATENPLYAVFCAARRCYSGSIQLPENPSVEQMTKTVNHVIDAGHTAVLEHASFMFHITGVSRVLTHQLVRHRLASFAQQSQRYADAQRTYTMPLSIASIPEAARKYDEFMLQAYELYGEFVTQYNIPKEDARFIVPPCSHTAIVMTMNARELFEVFFPLRCCMRAQWEIRDLAETMLYQVRERLPIIFNNTGPSCVRLGYCPEGEKGCGMVAPLIKMHD